MAEKLEGKQQYGSFGNKDLFEFMVQFDNVDDMKKGVIDGVIEFKHHIENMTENVRDLFREYLFPNLFNSVQVKIELRVAHEVMMSATIGDENSDAIIAAALDNMHKEIKEMEKEAE